MSICSLLRCCWAAVVLLATVLLPIVPSTARHDGESTGAPSRTVPGLSTNSAGATAWVRTVDGWERRIDLWPPRAAYRPKLHPLVIAAGEVLICWMALIAFPATTSAWHATSVHRRAHRVERQWLPHGRMEKN